ncbi:lipid-A-disaccharide synthase [Atopomonas sediminilitoris]|uniref:lipid-A-disaccharide synthase n=1 Tax=Atopomonas sediminilitoris TaxID=2919919 RepID=UPI001F4E496A|nr:lipid-A-disaccharide synthase [Atopomonas sediminilitoris]MCJ8169730.1 lipid-A-disaccharide synthase [Atopomonas sediminilitoris]
MSTSSLRIAIVVGEASGDILGAALMQALKTRHPQIEFIGIGGPRMLAEGMHCYFPQERLAVMGLVEVLGRLRELVKRRKQLVADLIAAKPDVVIGIDAPDFNLGLELAVRQAGIKTVHYVSPSVWAWRQKRVLKIRQACDLMLTLFPFEARFYEEHQVPVEFVGHSLADQVPLSVDQTAVRAELGLDPAQPVLALMPGSRGGEVERLGSLFFDTAERLRGEMPALQLVLPCATAERRSQLEAQLAGRDLPVQLLDGDTAKALTACDAVLIASGTATLEALLYRRPMVVAYRMAGLTYWLLRKLVKSPYISLPNLLAGEGLVPEILQEEATAERLAAEVKPLLQPCTQRDTLLARFAEIHLQLRRGAAERAADAVLRLIGRA